MTGVFPLPGVQHGNRFVPSVIDELAHTEPSCPWISLPVDDSDLSKGYREVTYGQFANYINHAARWLESNLPSSGEPFQPFAYAGPKDLRYPILAVAAGKIGKVMVLPSSLVTPEAQLHILSKTSCTTYIRSGELSAKVDEIAAKGTGIRTMAAPQLDDLLREDFAQKFPYNKSWEDGKDDPWLVFHTSGTTGHPKPITYTHRMMATPDTAASLDGIDETHIHHYAYKRWYTPLPMLHFVGMLTILSMSAYLRTVVVLGPVFAPPAPAVVKGVLEYGNVDGAMLPPALIDALCLDPIGLSALRTLQYIHYVGAPLSITSGQLLSDHVRVVPSIGSTEAGGYFIKLRNTKKDWDYIEFQPHAGAVFEPRLDNLHELVFVRRPECEPMQQIFRVYPDRERHPTSDLWIEHPSQRGLWKIVGRADDYVYLAHAEGLHASTLEPEIERHPEVQAALIGGHGRPKPVLLVELIPDAQHSIQTEVDHQNLLQSLKPYIDNVNAQCHPSVQLDPKLIVAVKKDKPLERTVKGSVARVQSLKLYDEEIDQVYQSFT